METERNGIFSGQMELKFYDCDHRKQAKLSTILKYMSELAGRDYTLKGLSHEYLWEQGLVFLLSRITLRLHRVPMYKEQFTLNTWEFGKRGVLFLRNYDLTDESGEVVADAQSAWVIVNPETRHLMRPSAFQYDVAQREDKEVSAPMPQKIAFTCTEGNKVGERRVRYSDLDANGHVYNAVYADIASDFAPSQIFAHTLTDFSLNFVSEAKLGDTIDMYMEYNGSLCTLCGEVAGKRCFESAIQYR